MQEPAEEGQAAEEALDGSGDEASQNSLEDAYSMILAQAGLTEDALQTALKTWMHFLAGEVSDLTKASFTSLYPGRHAQLALQQRLAKAVIMVAGKTSCLCKLCD